MENRVTKVFGLRYPVIQAPLLWNTNAEFVAAVSRAGGLGVLGPNAGQNKKPANLDEFSENLHDQIRKVRSLTEKPFGVNLLPPDATHDSGFTDATQRVILEEKPPIAVVVASNQSIAMPYVKECREARVKVIYRDFSPTVDLAIQAEKAGIDAYVATGFEEGGELPRNHISTLVLVPQIAKALSVPVIGCGAIVSTETAAAVKVLGAEGVYAGTRFITTHESPTAGNVKEIILKAKSEDMIEVGENVILNEERIVKRADGHVPEKVWGKDYYEMMNGDLSKGNVVVDEAVGAINELLSVKEVVEMLGMPFV